MTEKKKTIGFRGNAEYREKLARAALDRGIKVQGLLEAAVGDYLKDVPHSEQGPVLLRKADKGNKTHDTIHQEWVRILEELLEAADFPQFGKAIRENLHTFEFGLQSARQAHASADSVERQGTANAATGDDLKEGTERLSGLLKDAAGSLEGNSAPQKVTRKEAK